MPHLSTSLKATLVSASVGLVLIGILAACFKRRRRRPAYRDVSYDEWEDAVDTPPSPDGQLSFTPDRGHSVTPDRRTATSPERQLSQSRQNGDIPHARRSLSPIMNHMSSLSGSTTSINTELTGVSSVTIGNNDTTHYTPVQLCDLGLEFFQTAIQHWESAADKLEEMPVDILDDMSNNLRDRLHQLLERAYRLRDSHEQTVYRQISANVALDSAITAIQEMDREYEVERRRRLTNTSLDDSSSDLESFVSALDMADLSDLGEQKDTFQHLVLYEAGLLELEHGSIPCRTLRTKMVNCVSDTEFLAKLHCIRISLQDIFRDESIGLWFAESGKQIISKILTKADRDPEEFQAAYDKLMSYVRSPDSLGEMEQELRGRGVRVLTFYDVVIDFLIFDAFDDLENPPSSVTTVVQNRWLSNGFKETALSTAVWSVLKAKKRMLRVPNGFIAHFYAISEHISPVMAWGFLGPAGPLKDLCTFFKDQVLAFMRDIFSFEKVHYTSVEALSADILRLAKHRVAVVTNHLSS